ncbi:hypothetical protein ES703_66930 [subsurface metagenome]
MSERLAYSRQFNMNGATTSAAPGIGLAQPFWADSDSLIDEVYLFTKNNGDVTITISIRETDEDDMPTGSDLVSDIINLQDGVLSGGDDGDYPVYKHTMSLPLVITGSVNYAVVALASAGTPSWWLTFRNTGWKVKYPKDEGSKNYVNRWRRSTDGGVTWVLAGSPVGWWNFELYGVAIAPSRPISRAYALAREEL